MASTPDFPAKFDLPVPRYTSYPTALQFHGGIGPETYRDWLGRLAPDEPVSLYLHAPYCRELCWYCGCNTHVASRYRPVADYRDLLLAEIDRIAAALPARQKANRIHWGGGTPTILSPADFRAVQDRLRRCFDIGEDAEIAVEIDPRVLDAPMIEALSQSGVNRASLGVQDFDSAVQRAVNRWQPYEVTQRAVEGLRAAGIADDQSRSHLWPALSDRGQRVGDDRAGPCSGPSTHRPLRLCPRTLAQAASEAPPRRRPSRLPERAGRQSMAAARRLQELGYSWIGLDHFALPEDAMAEAAAGRAAAAQFPGVHDRQCRDAPRLRRLLDQRAAPGLCPECRRGQSLGGRAASGRACRSRAASP